MTNQSTEAQHPESKEAQAEKLRRVLSVKDPTSAPIAPSVAAPKPATR